MIEHTGWRLQDEACLSQPGDPPQGGVGGFNILFYGILFVLNIDFLKSYHIAHFIAFIGPVGLGPGRVIY